MKTFNIKRLSRTDQWKVCVKEGGKLDELACYYTDTEADAATTMSLMIAEQKRAVETNNMGLLLDFEMAASDLTVEMRRGADARPDAINSIGERLDALKELILGKMRSE
jgi:hypothetical protein